MKKLKKIHKILIALLIIPLGIIFHKVSAATFIFPDEINEYTKFNYNGDLKYQWIKSGLVDQEKINELNSLIDNLISNNDTLKSENDVDLATYEANKTEITNLMNKITSDQNENVSLNTELNEAKEQVQIFYNIVSSLEEKHYATIEEDAAEIKSQITALINENKEKVAYLNANRYLSTSTFFNANKTKIEQYANDVAMPRILANTESNVPLDDATYDITNIYDLGIIDGNYSMTYYDELLEKDIEGSDIKYLDLNESDPIAGITRIRVGLDTVLHLPGYDDIDFNDLYFTYIDEQLEDALITVIGLTEEVDGKEVTTVIGNNEKIVELVNEYNAKITIVYEYSFILEYRASLAEWEKKRDELQQEINDNNDEIATSQQKLQELDAEQTSLENEIAIRENTITNNENLIDSYRVSIAAEENNGKPVEENYLDYDGNIVIPIEGGEYDLWVLTEDEEKMKTYTLEAVPNKYILTILAGEGVENVKVTKVSGYGESGFELQNGDTIYEGDELVIEASSEVGYNLNQFTSMITVKENTVVEVSAVPKDYKLTITMGDGVKSVKVIKQSGYGEINKELKNGDTIYYGDELIVEATADNGNTLNDYKNYYNVVGNTEVKVDATKIPYKLTIIKGEGVNTLTVTKDNTNLNDQDVIYYGDTLIAEATAEPGYRLKEFNQNYNVIGNTTVEVQAEKIPYKLTIIKGTGVSDVVVTRNGKILKDGDTIYYGDALVVRPSSNEGYNLNEYLENVNVTGDTTIEITAKLKEYKLSIVKGEGVKNITVVKESGYGNVGETLNDGDTIYYGDKLVVTVEMNDGYTVYEYPASFTANGDVTVSLAGYNEDTTDVPQSHILKIVKDENVESVTVTKVSGFGITGIELSDGDPVYEGDELQVVAVSKDGYVMNYYVESDIVMNEDKVIEVSAKKREENLLTETVSGDVSKSEENNNVVYEQTKVENPKTGIKDHIIELLITLLIGGSIIFYLRKISLFKKL